MQFIIYKEIVLFIHFFITFNQHKYRELQHAPKITNKKTKRKL